MENKPTLTSTAEAMQIVSSARDAELSRNPEQIRQILSPVWPDIDYNPDFTCFPDLVTARLHRMAGFCLSLYGKANSKPRYQIRGRDLLTRAIDVFTRENHDDEAVEAQVVMAGTYWNSGEIVECETILNHLELKLAQRPDHPSYLRVFITRLMICSFDGDFAHGYEIIKRIEKPVSLCNDLQLIPLFHMNAGGLFWQALSFEKAIEHFNLAVESARQAGNYNTLVMNLNNLACCYSDCERFTEAEDAIDQAIGLIDEMNDQWLRATAYDTKSLINFKQERFEDALSWANTALEIIRFSEDAIGHLSSLWTKCRCLLKLNRTEEALALYGTLQHLAQTSVGQSASEKYARLLADEFGLAAAGVEATPTTPEADLFKEVLKYGLCMVENADLTKRFGRNTAVYYCSAEIMSQLGIEEDALVTIRTLKPAKGSKVLYKHDSYKIGLVEAEPDLDLLFVRYSDREMPLLVPDMQIIGVAELYCPFSSVSASDSYEFSPFE